MIAVDTNILVYAHREDSPLNMAALTALRPLVESSSDWAIPWPCVHEFISIVTHPKIYRPATSLGLAISSLEGLFDSPSLILLSETPGYWQVLTRLLKRSPVQGPRIHDAKIAALCISHGVQELWTADRDFSQFAGLKKSNPLTSTS